MISPQMICERVQFKNYAESKGFDTAFTIDSNTGRIIFLNPQTADLWDTWFARAEIEFGPLS